MRDELEEWKQAASVEAGLRREFSEELRACHQRIDELEKLVQGTTAVASTAVRSPLTEIVSAPWRPIETAPKDGSFVMLYVPDGQLETGPVTIGGYWKAEERDTNGRYKKGDWAWARFSGWLGCDADYRESWCEPTHWMPLPAPPQTQVGDNLTGASTSEPGNCPPAPSASAVR